MALEDAEHVVESNTKAAVPQKYAVVPVTLQLPEPRVKLALQWQNVRLQVADNPGSRGAITPQQHVKHVLRGVSGCARPGEMLAIMGASGAGKTTLLNVLARRNCKNSGMVTVNGQPLTHAYSSMMAYVQQEDLFYGHLTVREHLQYQMELRKEVTAKSQLHSIVDELITTMGLQKVAHSLIGSIQQGRGRGLSGGERKRLAVVSELLTDPCLLFLDEPTTGLDAYMSESVMKLLRGIASSGRTVVATIHQPSSDVWGLFDRVCFMCEGRVAFFGAPQDAVVQFSRIGYACPHDANPPDFLIKVLVCVPADSASEDEYAAALQLEQNRLATICDAWDASKPAVFSTDEVALWAAQHVTPQTRYSTSWWQQFTILTRRGLLAELRDPIVMKARVISMVVLGFIAGLTFYQLGYEQKDVQSRNGVLFFLMMHTSMNNLVTVLRTFPLERPLFQREHEDGAYSVSAFYVSKMITTFLPQVLVPMLFTTVAYWMCNMRNDVTAWLWCLLILTLTSLCASSAGYIVSLVSTNASVSVSGAQAILIPFLAFAGLFINLDTIPVYLSWFQHVSWFKYGYSAAVGVVWEGVQLQCPPTPAPCPFPDGNAVLSYLTFSVESRGTDLIFLAACILVLRMVAFGLLVWRSSQRTSAE